MSTVAPRIPPATDPWQSFPHFIDVSLPLLINFMLKYQLAEDKDGKTSKFEEES